MKSELCKTCIHTDVCMKDKNIAGDTFVAGNPMIFDNKKLYEKFKEREANGFPCDDYISAQLIARDTNVLSNDLISRQAAINALENTECELLQEEWDELTDAIMNLPSAQQEIVRCKDCKFFEIYELKKDYTDDKRYKPSVCVKGKFAVKRSENWFCADAERRGKQDG